MESPQQPLNFAELSPDGRLIAGAFTTWLLVYQVDHPETPPLRIAAHRGFVNFIRFSGDSSVLFSSGSERDCRSWNPLTGEMLGSFALGVSPRGDMAVSHDGAFAAAFDASDHLRVWETHSRNWLTRLGGPTNTVHCVRFSPDGTLLAAASADGAVNVWSTADHSLIWTSPHRPTALTALGFSPDGASLAVAGHDGLITISDSRTGDNPRQLATAPSMVTWLSYTPNSAGIAVAASDAAIHLFDARTGKETGSLTGHTARVVEAAFSPDGRSLAGVGADGLCIVWDWRIGAELLRLGEAGAAARAVCYSPDGSRIATGNDDWIIRIWDARAGGGGRCIQTLRDVKQHVFGLAFHPAGDILFSCCRDSVIQAWDVRTGRELASLDGHDGLVLSLAISPDGNSLATGSGDRTVGLWDLLYYQQHIRSSSPARQGQMANGK
jgi:WD40 repeat protein